MSARQRILSLMQELGIEPKKSLGQNFLISDHVIDKIVHAVIALKPASLLEIGPGLGALTEGLVQMKIPLSLIELDSVFAKHWQGRGFTVTEVDALQWDWTQLQSARPRVLVSNLPYQISSSILVDRCLDQAVDGMVLMFQKEVAQRIKARPQTSPYGMLSVVAQTLWDIELLLEASSGDFMPPPKVASRVLIFKAKSNSPIQDRTQFLKFVKSCFLHPRKMMISNILEGLGKRRDSVAEVFAKLSISEKVRGQELSPQQFVDLYLALGYR